MECPGFLPDEVKYCTYLPNEEQILASLKKRPSEFILFFEAACDDETWTSQHAGMMRKMLWWITRQFALRRWPLLYAEKAARAIQRHDASLEPHLLFRSALFYSVNIIFEGQSHWVNSLMFAIGSPFFRDKIQAICWEKLQNRMDLPEAIPANFPFIREYIYTGSVKDLWRREFNEVHQLMRQANTWGLTGLVWQCVDVLRRYLEKNNVIEWMLQAHQDNLVEWKHACFQFFNKQGWGLLFLEKGGDQLAIEFLNFDHDTLELFKMFAPYVTHLAFRGVLDDRPTFNELLIKMS